MSAAKRKTVICMGAYPMYEKPTHNKTLEMTVHRHEATAYTMLTLEKLRNHPDFRFLPHGDLQKCKDLAKDIFPKVEKLKELLNKQFEEEYLRWYENEDKKLEAEREMKRQEEEKIRRREQEKRDAKGNVKLPPTPPTLPYNSLIIEPVKIPDNIIYDEPEKGLPSESMQAMTGLSESDRDLNWSNDKGEEKVKKLVAGARPDVNRALKPSTGPLTAEQNENSNTLGLKSLWIPNSLINRFIDIAEKNTLRNIETCGVLAGKLGFGKFVCSHLIIPEQTGTSDSCVTLKEENIFEVQDKNQLLTLGWIHTHPTQSCFLSSVDLHTQCSYQLLMPEAVALVCAIKCDE
ncbi:hypothetical protein QYM36_004137 [Artemia franciscana]|uniref:MPN domain-containing protein n=1 Tax=Artemia franciscana TaxID=6661 RepID=A0AA88HZJ3_ARTSF|nr:hypothetical protein QYM36_004137 [Artemia franciscana]